MTHNDNIYQRYFVSNVYHYSGAPKLEQLAFDYARQTYLHCSVYETDLGEMVADIKAYKDLQHLQNRRLDDVDIHLTKDNSDGIRWLGIGQHHLVLQRIKKEFEIISNSNVIQLSYIKNEQK